LATLLRPSHSPPQIVRVQRQNGKSTYLVHYQGARARAPPPAAARALPATARRPTTARARAPARRLAQAF